MEKNELLCNLVDMLYLTKPTDWEEILFSSKPSQKDFVLTKENFTYKVKKRIGAPVNIPYLDDNPNTPYTIEVEEGGTTRPIYVFNDETKYKKENGEEYINRHIEELFLHIEGKKREWENGAVSRLEKEILDNKDKL